MRYSSIGVTSLLGILLIGIGGALSALPSIDPQEISVDRVIAMRSEIRGVVGNLFSRVVGREDEPLFTRPYGIAWNDSELLVTDTGRGSVIRIDGRGALKTSASGTLSQPVGVIPCLGGIAVSDSQLGGVALFDDSLVDHEWLILGLNRPTGLACLGDLLAVVETGAHRIHLVSRDGTKTDFGTRGDGPGEFNFPTLAAVDGAEILVGDALNFRVQRFDHEGNYLDEFGQLGDSAGTMPRMKGIAVDEERRIWITDAFLDQIAVYAPDGTFLMTIGHPGAEAGAFSFPAGIAVGPDGRVAVADAYNQRVQVLRIGKHAGSGR